MKITQAILDNLTEKAKSSPRKRMNMDLRDSIDGQSQRLLNAIEPESVVPVHRHQKSSETVVCLRGRVVVLGWGYVPFMKKYYHLHEAYLASLKK